MIAFGPMLFIPHELWIFNFCVEPYNYIDYCKKQRIGRYCVTITKCINFIVTGSFFSFLFFTCDFGQKSYGVVILYTGAFQYKNTNIFLSTEKKYLRENTAC